MKKFWMASVSALALAAIASPAGAGQGYVSAGVGFASGWDERNWDREPPKSTPKFTTGTVMFDGSPAFEGAIGYDTGPLNGSQLGIRAEVQATYLDYSVDEVAWGPTSSSVPVRDRAGHLTQTLWMANLLLDLHLDGLGGFTPYIGGGIGVARGVIDVGVNAPGSAPPGIFQFDDATDSGFVWQFILGASVPVTSTLQVYGNYRMIDLPDFVADDEDRRGGPVTFEGDITHALLIGIRASF